MKRFAILFEEDLEQADSNLPKSLIQDHDTIESAIKELPKYHKEYDDVKYVFYIVEIKKVSTQKVIIESDIKDFES